MSGTRVPAKLAYFDRVRVINLPSRADRRRAAARELASLGERVDGERVAFHVATRPTEAAGFDTIGTHGCFLSHLSALQDAHRDDVASLLILEDDVAFSASEMTALSTSIAALTDTRWGIFYGGSPVPHRTAPLSKLLPDEPVLLAHFIAFDRATIRRLVPYLEAILERPAGSPEGGPMHVDGAYSWFRRAHPDVSAYAATPNVAHQRASATDIHHRRGIDRLPVLRSVLVPARYLKNLLRARK